MGRQGSGKVIGEGIVVWRYVDDESEMVGGFEEVEAVEKGLDGLNGWSC